MTTRFLAAALLLTRAPAAEPPHSADVLVYGATPAGVCAAVSAAREGASVLLLEPTDHIGGVNTGGLCFSDSNQMARTALRGLFEEFHRRMEDDYHARGVELPYSVAEKNQKHWTYEPHVAAKVTDAMLKAPPAGEWLMWRRSYNAWGYSPLDQVNAGNVKNLRLVWSTGLTTGRQEGTPLVHDGVMYFPMPTDAIRAMDARTGDLLWEYKRAIPG